MRKVQQELRFKQRGGKRRGAGRRPKGARSSQPHKRRPEHIARYPVHVTLRAAGDITRLRTNEMFAAFRQATTMAARRADFRIVHLSIQGNHVHLIAEAEHRIALARGMQGFEISAAKHINAVTGRRGAVFPDHYHARPLTSPRAVRNCLAYVLNNWRRHREDRAPHTRTWMIDPFSSAVSFPSWREADGGSFIPPSTYQPLLVSPPRTWLLSTGWSRHHPSISIHETPGPPS
ncbi:MAG: transposase [Kofleriaceae bacterium]